MAGRESCLDDKRGVELVLTPEGFDAITRMAKLHVASVRANIVDILSPEQFKALGDAMATVRDHLDPDGLSGR